MQVDDTISKLQRVSHELDFVNIGYNQLEEKINDRIATLKLEDKDIADWQDKMDLLSQRRHKLSIQVAELDAKVTEAGRQEWLANGGKKKMYGGVVQIRQTQSPIHMDEQDAITTILQAVAAEAILPYEGAAMLKIVRSAVVKAHKRDCIVAREILKYKDTTKAAIIPSGLVNWKK